MNVGGAFEWAGTITVSNWTMAPDGETYLHFWAPRWRVVNEKEAGEAVGLGRIRSQDGFFIVGYADGSTEPQLVIPGCQFKAFTRADQSPNSHRCYGIVK